MILAKGTKRKLKDSGKLSKKVKLADLDSDDEDDDEDDEDYEEDMSALDFLDDEASEEEEDSDDMCKIKLGCSYCPIVIPLSVHLSVCQDLTKLGHMSRNS